MKRVQWQGGLPQLQKAGLFRNVAAPDLERLLREFRAYELEPGEVLLTPFNRNEYLYLLLEGELKVYLGSLDGQAVSTLQPGDCVGEISFIDNEHPSAYVIASRRSQIIGLHREALTQALGHSPTFMQNLLELLCKRVRQGNRLIVDTEQHANVDTLTGAFTRRWLEHVFERESTRCAFDGQPLCLLMIDVDNFKDYNDAHGHLAGDYALCLVAHTLRNQLRPKDSLARYGGEEFVILLPDVALEEGRAIGERLRVALEQVVTFYSPVGVLPGVTVSLGLTQMRQQDSLQTLIARADEALYQAKQAGRNCLCG